MERQLAGAEILVTSRLSVVETARAFLRVRLLGERPESQVTDAEREVADLWRHCEVWEPTAEICSLAERVAPKAPLRSLYALHLATFVLARRHLEGLELLTTDECLRQAAGTLREPG